MLPKFLKPYHTKKSNLIRIGPNTDGGYVIDKRIINRTRTIITCGLNDDWEFEKDFLKKNNKCEIIAYDHTVNQKFWKERFLKDFLSLILLKKIKLNKIIDVFKYVDYLFFFRKNIKHIEKKIVSKKRNNKEITINEIMQNKKKVFLKVDIEGSEYEVLRDIKKNINKIDFLIIEFHDVDKNIRKIKNFLSKNNLKIIHLHANNYGGVNRNKIPKVLELSMLNLKTISLKNIKSKKKYPIMNLDYKNFKRREDIKIQFS